VNLLASGGRLGDWKRGASYFNLALGVFLSFEDFSRAWKRAFLFFLKKSASYMRHFRWTSRLLGLDMLYGWILLKSLQTRKVAIQSLFGMFGA
jgi:hypothetical protein